jgi:hypothetical protein
MKAFAWVLFFFAGLISAQPPAAVPPPPAAGQVSGHVFCGDTGQPARFASVQLIAEQPDKAPILDPASLNKNGDFEITISSAMSAMMKNSNLSAITGLDGSFSLDTVLPGTYYVVAQLPGYLSPLTRFSMMERTKADDATLKAISESAEKLVLEANQPAHVELRLERGASLSGTVSYDDGSPAPGVNPILLALGKDGKWKQMVAGGLSASLTVTDDHGRFRISGIAAGKYTVKAALPTTQAVVGLGNASSGISFHMNMGDALEVYSGGALREKDVKPIEVGPGAEVEGVEIVFPLNNLHTVSGSVVAKADGHAINSGMISLLDSDTKSSYRNTPLGQDGSFKMNYIPEGQYLLRVSSVADVELSGADSNNLMMMHHPKALKSYGNAELPVTVKDDATGLSLQVPDEQAAPSAAETKSKSASGIIPGVSPEKP